METTILCRCCLLRPPDKDLRTPYVHLGTGVPEVYMDMLEKCFEINVSNNNNKAFCYSIKIQFEYICYMPLSMDSSAGKGLLQSRPFISWLLSWARVVGA
jgi:hypothetical protein